MSVGTGIMRALELKSGMAMVNDVELQEFADRLLLVGVNYDKKSKRHECRIEKIVKRCLRHLFNNI